MADQADFDNLKAGKENLVSAEELEKEFNSNSSAFEALERDFQEVINELMGDSNLEKFRLDYEKLHRALKKSHEQEKRLIKKCRELNSEIVNNQAKIKTALKLSQEDQQTIAHLQKEIEKTWKLVYQSQEKETRATETINALKEEIVKLATIAEQKTLIESDHDTIVNELKASNETLSTQLLETEMKISDYERTIQYYQKIQSDLQNESSSMKRQFEDMTSQYNTKEKQYLKELLKNEKVTKDFEQLQLSLLESQTKSDKYEEESKNNKAMIHELTSQLKESKSHTMKHIKEYETLLHKSNKLTEDLESQIQKNKERKLELTQLESDIKTMTLEIGKLTADKSLLERKYEKEKKEVVYYKDLVESSKIPVTLAKQEIESLKNDIILLQKKEADLQYKYDLLSREKEKQTQETEKAEKKVMDNLDIITEHTRLETNLNLEIKTYQNEVGNLKRTIQTLERDRDKLQSEITVQRNHYIASEEDIKLKVIEINELNIKLTELESKLKHQLKLYDAIRIEKNELNKAHMEVQNELIDYKKDNKLFLQQIKQLQDELNLKEIQISKDEFEYNKLEKMNQLYQNEISKKNTLLSNDQNLLEQHIYEIKKLSDHIKDLDNDILLQKKEYDKIINERDIIGLQLIRRNDEIALLNEKIYLQETTLKNGELEYNKRIEDISLLKLKLKDVIRDYSLTKNSGNTISTMKNQILKLEKDVLQERIKVTALSEELENPMNIHRWRKLEGSDPAAYELIQKVQILQKKLILKTEEVVEKTLVIQEKNKQYDELKELLARQPGPEIGDQINTYQRNLRNKTEQLKVMASEMTMYQAQANEYKYDVERLQREIIDLKRKYFQSKRREEMNLNTHSNSLMMSSSLTGSTSLSGVSPSMNVIMSPIPMSGKQQMVVPQKTKYAGGGFAIRQPYT